MRVVAPQTGTRANGDARQDNKTGNGSERCTAGGPGVQNDLVNWGNQSRSAGISGLSKLSSAHQPRQWARPTNPPFSALAWLAWLRISRKACAYMHLATSTRDGMLWVSSHSGLQHTTAIHVPQSTKTRATHTPANLRACLCACLRAYFAGILSLVSWGVFGFAIYLWALSSSTISITFHECAFRASLRPCLACLFS